MMKREYRKWFEDTRKNNQKTIEQTETIFEQRIIQIASGAMAISFSFITALSSIITYRFLGVLLLGWALLVGCIILNILSHLKAKKNCQENISKIDEYLYQDNLENNSDTLTYNKIQEISALISTKNKRMDRLYNEVSTWLMIGGIVIILAFVALNIAYPKNNEEADVIEVQDWDLKIDQLDCFNFSQYE